MKGTPPLYVPLPPHPEIETRNRFSFANVDPLGFFVIPEEVGYLRYWKNSYQLFSLLANLGGVLPKP